MSDIVSRVIRNCKREQLSETIVSIGKSSCIFPCPLCYHLWGGEKTILPSGGGDFASVGRNGVDLKELTGMKDKWNGRSNTLRLDEWWLAQGGLPGQQRLVATCFLSFGLDPVGWSDFAGSRYDWVDSPLITRKNPPLSREIFTAMGDFWVYNGILVLNSVSFCCVSGILND